MKKFLARLHPAALLSVAKLLWSNRKAELALVAALASVAREVVQAATGH